MSLIACKNLVMGYDGHIAVDNVSFDLNRGDYLCIVGENGSGKSTLIKGILGLAQPIEGSITFNGIEQTEIGYLPQQTMVQKDFPANVFEVIISGCLNQHRLLPFYTKEDREKASQNMKLLGIESLKKKSYRDLSGGQQQRVLLARALCATQHLLILDEPITGLDPIMTLNLYDLISELNDKHNLTIVMVSHDIKSAIKYANKILHLDTNTLFFGSVDKYLTTDIYSMIGGLNNV